MNGVHDDCTSKLYHAIKIMDKNKIYYHVWKMDSTFLGGPPCLKAGLDGLATWVMGWGGVAHQSFILIYINDRIVL